MPVNVSNPYYLNMATPSTDPAKSWRQLVTSARQATPPAGLDLRAAIRAVISAQPAADATANAGGALEDLLDLFRMKWLQAGLAIAAAIAFFACMDGLDIVNELVFFWQLQGPLVNGI